ncbi:hypothetical protein [Leptolyngbya ohadii]|uniref:hypothetical protein n=1 Tax=Leptolyngbya ohadii TaxID=1962290 RepID=UPI000B59B8E8|nr:hypothetical protein [Leptolyngbya ohadii]
MPLPPSDRLDIEALSRLFDRTTNSYKYLFFLGLLDELQQRQFDAATPIPLKDVIVEMLARAWRAHHTHHLKFGTQDQIVEKLNELDAALPKPLFRVKDVSPTDLRGMIRGRVADSTVELLRYVPFRLIRPFFEEELRGARDAQVNQKILVLSQAEFETRKPLYTFTDDQQAIILHPAWATYLKENHAEVQQWAFEAWVEYMERCNPGIDSIASKLPLTLLLLTLHTGGLSWQHHLTHLVSLLDSNIAS